MNVCAKRMRNSIVIAIRKGIRKSRKHTEQTLMNIIKNVSNNCAIH